MNNKSIMFLLHFIPILFLATFAHASGKEKPNVVLIMADDMGYECVRAYGSTSYHTPNLDKLAAEGILFTHAYSNPLCTPTRVTLMTGLYGHRNYKRFGRMPKGERTFGHMMQEGGYQTCLAASKWQLGPVNPEGNKDNSNASYPGETGFDTWIASGVSGTAHYWKPRQYFSDGKPVSIEPNTYGPDMFCDFVVDFIQHHRKDKPFFVYYPMKLPHWPFLPTPDSEEQTLEESTAFFADMIRYLDKLVGKVVDAVDESGVRKNTVIIFTGDNGTHSSILTQMEDGTIRGDKGQFTDGGTRVPLIASWKGKPSEGTVCDDLIDFTDFYATFADMAGRLTKESNYTDGVSFLPQLQGREGNPRDWVFVFQRDIRVFEQGRTFPSNYFARNRRCKLYSDGRMYDIRNDVQEQNPIMPGDGSPEIKAIRQELRQAFKQIDVSPADLDPELSK